MGRRRDADGSMCSSSSPSACGERGRRRLSQSRARATRPRRAARVQPHVSFLLPPHQKAQSSPLSITMADKVDAPTSSDASLAKGDNGNGPKATIKNVDMSEDMQQEAVDVALTALEKYNIEKDIAAQIKKEFDKRHGPTWHVVVGKNFGSYVTHETKHFIYFYIGTLAILIWKS
ncbi:hypothetical protein GY45DRAFT_1126728 [Cubamyces sp. BRFM 1775]|nr:hypothetical protein GY45DRAFT_1126728 [Cubamyces sp. BRFM 1775]